MNYDLSQIEEDENEGANNLNTPLINDKKQRKDIKSYSMFTNK